LRVFGHEPAAFSAFAVVANSLGKRLVIALPDAVPGIPAQDRLYDAGDAFVALVPAIEADAEDIELGTEGVRTGTREEQSGESAG
jgi:hypothetical protein